MTRSRQSLKQEWHAINVVSVRGMSFVLTIGVLGKDRRLPAMNDLGSRWQSGYRKAG